MSSEIWRVVITADGSPTLVHPRHGEACHSRAGAWQEARERYAAACRLRERALGDPAVQGRGSLRLLDVGCGLGFNLAAALEALDGSGVRLSAVSLELERSVIESTLELGPQSDPALERWHRPLREAFARALEADATRWLPLGDLGELLLVFGDGRERLSGLDQGLGFDAVFLDPFSPGVDGALWEAGFLGEVARRMDGEALLSTYSAASAVRRRLREVGLKVGRGGRVGTKREGTLAGKSGSERFFQAPLGEARGA